MPALGMTLTVREIVASLRNWPLVAKAFVANVTLLPLLLPGIRVDP